MAKSKKPTTNSNGNSHSQSTVALNETNPLWKDIVSAGLPRPEQPPQLTVNQVEELKDIVFNLTSLRADFLKSLADPRRSLNDECGYPETNALTVTHFKDLYDRLGVAARVVNCLPDESWMVSPEVFETEDTEDETEFEKAWDELGQSLRNGSKYQDEKGSIVWDYLRRADALSRIGFYGAIFLGFDDGLDLSLPVPGIDPDGDPRDIPGTSSGQSPIKPSDKAKQIATGGNGTELQYGPQGWGQTDEPQKPQPKSGEITLQYIRVYDQSLLQISQYEADVTNRRYGQPVTYMITMSDQSLQQGGIGVDFTTHRVHWSRVIHICDNLTSSEVFSPPAMRPVYNHLRDIQKLYGASAEGYWKSCFTGLSFETHPQLGGDVKVNKTGLRDMVEQYQNGLQRYLVLMGMSAKSIAPSVIDPTPFIETQIEAICILLGIPVRIFKGSERGELASSQDDSTWNDRLAFRQNGYLTPRVIVPFIDRLISVGVLPEPEGYSVKWPDLNALTDAEKSAILLQRTQAFAAYLAGEVQNLVPPQDYLTREADYTDEEAQAVLKSAEDHQAEAYPQAESSTPGHIPAPPTPEPSPASPITMGPGQQLVHPETGKTLAKTPFPPQPKAK